MANARQKVGGLFKRKKKPENDELVGRGGSTTSLDSTNEMPPSRSRDNDSNGENLIVFDESDYSDG